MKRTMAGFFTIVLILALCSYIIMQFYMPYFKCVVKKTESVYKQYKAAQDTLTLTAKLKKMRSDIDKIDSILRYQTDRESEVKNNITDALYQFADSSSLKTSKVEIGEKAVVGRRNETSISVSATGDYSSFGRFIESIENYPKSTRIRQVVLKKSDKKEIEGIVDFIYMEP